MAESAGPGLLRLSDGDVEGDPAGAAQKLTAALEQKPQDAANYCQRAFAHILLQNYHDAVTDAKMSLTLDPSNAVAFLRQGVGEYHMKNYGSALKSFREGQQLNSADMAFSVWIKRCEEAINAGLQNAVDDNQILQHQSKSPKIKHDWYQTESHIIVTIMIKNAKKDDVNIQFSEKELDVFVRLLSEEDYNLKLHLLHSIVPEQCTFKVLSTKAMAAACLVARRSAKLQAELEEHQLQVNKCIPGIVIEIKMKKPEAVRWEKLEGHGGSPKLKQFVPVSDATHLYPSSSHYTRNWDKLVGEIKEEEKNEKLEGDAALNKLFQQIYSDGTDEVKRAMNKSFMESGGTVLSTNWSDVGKRKVEVNPPDDMEWKKF